MKYTIAALATFAAIAIVAPAEAAEFRPFSAAALQAARAEGRPVLVHVHADWCPVCRAQAPLIRSQSAGAVYDRLLILTLDFDDQKAERKALGVGKQSTLIAFAGGREVARTIGQTSPDAIRAMLDRALDR
jgi:thioredoxin-like negative regulator of GroEL